MTAIKIKYGEISVESDRFCLAYKNNGGSMERTFTAPGAHILLVDDNEINLNVGLALLEDFKMNIDTAENGKDAVEKALEATYDLVFMDHMMPVMDGVEAVKELRRRGGWLSEMPVIALTANSPEDEGDLYSKAGFTAFMEKPIDPVEAGKMLRRYLPQDMICEEETEGTESETSECDLPVIEGIDSEAGLKATGTYEMYLRSLGDFYKQIDIKSTKIEKCLADEMIRDYTVEVHALKSTSRMLGALELSEEFKNLEDLGDKEALDELNRLTPGVLRHYRDFKERLKPYGSMNDENKKPVGTDEMIARLLEIRDAMENFDLDGADNAMKELNTYKVPENIRDKVEQMDALVADVAMEDSIRLAAEIISALGGNE